MAWNVGYEEIDIDNIEIDGQWEVDADSEESAKNEELIPYLLVGVMRNYGSNDQYVSWVTSSELRESKGTQKVVTCDIDDDGEVVITDLTEMQVSKLVSIMEKVSKGVTRSDFLI